jgi:hypothetical protein
MPTSAGVGHSEQTSSYEAAREAAQDAMARAATGSCDLAMLFASAPHDALQLRDGVRSVIGTQAKLFGASAPGIITNDYLGYTGSQVGVAVLSSDTATFDLFAETGLPNAESVVGRALGRRIRGKPYTGQYNVLILYDAVKQAAQIGRPEMNFATPLIEGLSAELEPWPPFAGCGSLSDPGFNYSSVQFNDDEVLTQSAVALVSSGALRMDTTIMHGTRPGSGYHTITKAEANVVLEIDGKPALDVISELLGSDSGLDWEDYPLLITFGVNKGGKFNPFAEQNYANRLCLAIDKERRGLIMFEPDLKAGAEVQLMRRSIDFKYIEERSRALLNQLDGRRPVFAFYIDCVGRCAAYSGMDQEEAAEVQRHIGSRMPLLGIYSGVEIAKVGDDIQALDWTGVLCLFSESR